MSGQLLSLVPRFHQRLHEIIEGETPIWIHCEIPRPVFLIPSNLDNFFRNCFAGYLRRHLHTINCTFSSGGEASENTYTEEEIQAELTTLHRLMLDTLSQEGNRQVCQIGKRIHWNGTTDLV